MHGDNCTYIRTATGQRFWPLDPRPQDLDIIDIAHHLAYQGRFSGATRRFYSVAEHSCRVSLIRPTLQALLHDASEAYCVDVPRPIKHDPAFSVYRDVEQKIWLVIAERFAVKSVMDPLVHRADNCLLLAEKRDLMPSNVATENWNVWMPGIYPPITASDLPPKIYSLAPEVAMEWFLDRFHELGGKA
jgi:5'-deoxynucleotidase YfbR-like HD superfamily hydrolase